MTPQEREKFVNDVACAIRSSEPVLTADEVQYVKLAIKKEAQSIALRNAIIEKTLAGLAWSAIVGLGILIVEWAKAHGYKP
jgi:hypothetical protein